MGIYRRGKVWWMQLSYKGRLIRKSTETRDKRLAEKIHAKVLTQITEGKWFDRPVGADKTFRELMEKYEEEKFSELASGTRRGCKSYLEGLVAYFGDYAVTEITPRMINEFKQARKAEGVTGATVNRQMTIMKRAYNIAIREWEWLDANPVNRVASERENSGRDRWLTLDEEERLLAACPERLREIVTFALNTGMRLGEVLGLPWKAVDFERRTVTVLKSKNGDRRTIPLNATLLVLLRGRAKVRPLKTDHVFYTSNHRPVHPCSLRRDFVKAVKKAKLEDFRFHDLRHTFATRLVQAGVDLYRVGRLLGHRDIRMTQRYSHHSPESLREGVLILDGLREGPGSTISAQSAEMKKRTGSGPSATA